MTTRYEIIAMINFVRKMVCVCDVMVIIITMTEVVIIFGYDNDDR